MAIEFKISRLEIVSALMGEIKLKLADRANLSLLEDKEYDGYTVILKKKKQKTQNINNYLWVLCDRLAEKVKITKEDVYRKAVREVGVWFDIQVRAGEEESLKKTWASNGIGWFAEEGFASRDFTNMRLYKGSSVYDSEEMRRLVDYIVDECRYHQIETMTPAELEHLHQLWKG